MLKESHGFAVKPHASGHHAYHTSEQQTTYIVSTMVFTLDKRPALRLPLSPQKQYIKHFTRSIFLCCRWTLFMEMCC